MSGRTTVRAIVAAAVVALLTTPAPSAAQTRPVPPRKPPAKPHPPAPHPGSIEVGGGLAWDAGYDLGTTAATETRNIGTGTTGLDLFTTDNSVRAAFGVAARLGYYVTRTVSIEGGFQYLKPEAASRISGDAEGAQPLTAAETLGRYVFDVSGLWHVNALAFAGGRALPFVLGGGGYIRELHEGSELVETGSEIHGGAGIRYYLTRGARRYGLRGEFTMESRSGGYDEGDGRRTLARLGASFFLVF